MNEEAGTGARGAGGEVNPSLALILRNWSVLPLKLDTLLRCIEEILFYFFFRLDVRYRPLVTSRSISKKKRRQE